MTRLFRLVLGAALLSAAACSGGTPTAPAPNTMTPRVEALLDGDPPADDCRGGFSVQNGRAC